MLKLELTNRFQRDYKRLVSRGYDISKLDCVIGKLLEQVPLSPLNLDHPLKGKWLGSRGCHITGDWVLVYSIDDGKLWLKLLRTGTHSDVYGK